MNTPQVGDWALHKNNRLDSRQVIKVSEDGTHIWIAIGSLEIKVPAENYTYSRR